MNVNLIRSIDPIVCSFRKSAGAVTTIFEAGRDYIISTSQLEKISQDENVKNRLYKVSRLDHRLQPFNPNFKKPGTQRLLFYIGSGGYGDCITSWPVAKWLSEQGFDVHVAADPGNQSAWYNFPWVKTIETMPMPYERFKLYDYHFVMEFVNNTDEHQDQLHPIDTMLSYMGVDWRSIPPEKKVVEPTYTWAEQQSIRNVCPDKHYLGIYQLSSANPIRALLPNDSAFLIFKVAEAFPGIHWLCVYDEFNNKAYVEALKCRDCKGTGKSSDEAVCPACKGTTFLLPNIQPYTSPNLRDLWALTKFRASIVVSPDSMMAHVAGCQSVPCVGLWGPVAPPNRMMYYRNHFPIFHREACCFSPCFAYTAVFPRYCPPRGAGRTVCEVIAAVTPSEVIEAVKKIRR